MTTQQVFGSVSRPSLRFEQRSGDRCDPSEEIALVS